MEVVLGFGALSPRPCVISLSLLDDLAGSLPSAVIAVFDSVNIVVRLQGSIPLFGAGPFRDLMPLSLANGPQVFLEGEREKGVLFCPEDEWGRGQVAG